MREDPVIDRRTFLAGTRAVLLAAPLAAEAQQAGKVYTIGWLTLSASPVSITFRQALQSLGWIEGKNVVILYKTAEFRSERLSEIVAEFVDLKVDVIVAVTAEAALAAKRGTQTIPIVAVDPADAVAIGLVASLAHPGGNVTGLSYLGTELASKQMELFKETIPSLSRVAILTNPANPTHLPRREAAAGTARRLGVKSETLTVRTPDDLEKAFGEMARLRVGGVLVVTDPMFNSATDRLVRLASKSSLPAMYGFRTQVAAGGLMSYGVELADLFRRAPTYVDKILKGAKPADLPIEQPTKFELVINLKTAKALGLTIPPSLLGRADEVIQ
jgi:putative tryptophan/tyrosine transport system substrate-binding protein